VWVEERQGAVRLGRYMIRCPIALKRLSWAKLIRRVHEVDPLLCPFCGA
jgi:hypothetical protein